MSTGAINNNIQQSGLTNNYTTRNQNDTKVGNLDIKFSSSTASPKKTLITDILNRSINGGTTNLSQNELNVLVNHLETMSTEALTALKTGDMPTGTTKDADIKSMKQFLMALGTAEENKNTDITKVPDNVDKINDATLAKVINGGLNLTDDFDQVDFKLTSILQSDVSTFQAVSTDKMNEMYADADAFAATANAGKAKTDPAFQASYNNYIAINLPKVVDGTYVRPAGASDVARQDGTTVIKTPTKNAPANKALPEWGTGSKKINYENNAPSERLFIALGLSPSQSSKENMTKALDLIMKGDGANIKADPKELENVFGRYKNGQVSFTRDGKPLGQAITPEQKADLAKAIFKNYPDQLASLSTDALIDVLMICQKDPALAKDVGSFIYTKALTVLPGLMKSEFGRAVIAQAISGNDPAATTVQNAELLQEVMTSAGGVTKEQKIALIQILIDSPPAAANLAALRDVFIELDKSGVELFKGLPKEVQGKILMAMNNANKAVAYLNNFSIADRATILKGLTPSDAAKIIAKMPDADAYALLSENNLGKQSYDILNSLPEPGAEAKRVSILKSGDSTPELREGYIKSLITTEGTEAKLLAFLAEVKKSGQTISFLKFLRPGLDGGNKVSDWSKNYNFFIKLCDKLCSTKEGGVMAREIADTMISDYKSTEATPKQGNRELVGKKKGEEYDVAMNDHLNSHFIANANWPAGNEINTGEYKGRLDDRDRLSETDVKSMAAEIKNRPRGALDLDTYKELDSPANRGQLIAELFRTEQTAIALEMLAIEIASLNSNDPTSLPKALTKEFFASLGKQLIPLFLAAGDNQAILMSTYIKNDPVGAAKFYADIKNSADANTKAMATTFEVEFKKGIAAFPDQCAMLLADTTSMTTALRNDLFGKLNTEEQVTLLSNKNLKPDSVKVDLFTAVSTARQNEIITQLKSAEPPNLVLARLLFNGLKPETAQIALLKSIGQANLDLAKDLISNLPPDKQLSLLKGLSEGAAPTLANKLFNKLDTESQAKILALKNNDIQDALFLGVNDKTKQAAILDSGALSIDQKKTLLDMLPGDANKMQVLIHMKPNNGAALITKQAGAGVEIHKYFGTITEPTDVTLASKLLEATPVEIARKAVAPDGTNTDKNKFTILAKCSDIFITMLLHAPESSARGQQPFSFNDERAAFLGHLGKEEAPRAAGFMALFISEKDEILALISNPKKTPGGNPEGIKIARTILNEMDKIAKDLFNIDRGTIQAMIAADPKSAVAILDVTEDNTKYIQLLSELSADEVKTLFANGLSAPRFAELYKKDQRLASNAFAIMTPADQVKMLAAVPGDKLALFNSLSPEKQIVLINAKGENEAFLVSADEAKNFFKAIKNDNDQAQVLAGVGRDVARRNALFNACAAGQQAKLLANSKTIDTQKKILFAQAEDQLAIIKDQNISTRLAVQLLNGSPNTATILSGLAKAEKNPKKAADILTSLPQSKSDPKFMDNILASMEDATASAILNNTKKDAEMIDEMDPGKAATIMKEQGTANATETLTELSITKPDQAAKIIIAMGLGAEGAGLAVLSQIPVSERSVILAQIKTESLEKYQTIMTNMPATAVAELASAAETSEAAVALIKDSGDSTKQIATLKELFETNPSRCGEAIGLLAPKDSAIAISKVTEDAVGAEVALTFIRIATYPDPTLNLAELSEASKNFILTTCENLVPQPALYIALRGLDA